MRLVLIFIALAVVLTVPFLIWGDDFDVHFGGSSDWLENYGGWAWAVALALLTADIVLPVPGTAVMAALGVVYGALLGGTIGALGSWLSGMVAYGVSRLLGRDAALKLAGAKDLERGERFFRADGGGWAVALSRWLPLLPEVIACLAGLARMPVKRFAVALACGAVPLGFTFAAVGASGRESPTLAIVLSAALPLVVWPVAARLLASGRRPEKQ